MGKLHQYRGLAGDLERDGAVGGPKIKTNDAFHFLHLFKKHLCLPLLIDARVVQVFKANQCKGQG